MAEPQDKYCINCWSGPRCCSTSTMYSFAQRSDTQVMDEPLYASYLKLTGLPRPYRDQVLATQENDGSKVVKQIMGPRSKKVLYAKHIAKQKIGVENTLYARANHMLLVREPYGVVLSFSKVLQPTLQELGYGALLEVYSELRALGRNPIVVLSDDLVRRPEPMLRALCAALELPFEPSMLHWAAGPKPYDGVWAPWWYGNTHRSTGFDVTLRDSREPMPEHLKPLLGECQPLFDMLRRHALRPVDDSVPRPMPPAGSILGLQHQHQAATSTPKASASFSNCGDATATAGPRFSDDATATSVSSAAALAAGVSGLSVSVQPMSPPGVQRADSFKGSGSKTGTHVYVDDPRNANVLIGIRDGVADSFELHWRPHAKVSVLDSGFMLGDGVWEGIRLHKGVLVFLEEHLDRLWEGAKAIDMELGVSRERLQQMVYHTVDANGMGQASHVHIRLMVTRGLKPTPYQNPNTTIGLPTIVIIPEWKEAAQGPKEEGIRLFTSHVRRGAPDVQDPSWNSHSKLNCIAACIQANKAGVDEALMLDPHGFVATCNSTNFFMVRRGELWAPTTRYQLHGITRANVLKLAQEASIPTHEADFTLTQVYSADEAFVTGTFAGLIPVREVDGRMISDGRRGGMTAALQQAYMLLMDREAAGGRGQEAAARQRESQDY